VAIAASASLVLTAAQAAPDEQRLGKAAGYPVGTASSWYADESVRVGSYTHQAEIPGIFHGEAHRLAPSSRPMPLPTAPSEPAYRWSIGDERGLGVDDFLARQRIMGLLIVKDGVVQVERYQYDRRPTDCFTSNSMAKSLVALAVGIALHEGRIASLDDPAQRYAPRLSGTLLGETTIRNLLRMASGARYLQTYDGTGDTAWFSAAVASEGIEKAARRLASRDVPQGTRFAYASPHSVVLAAVVRGATGMSLSDYLAPRLWQPVGAEHAAYWRADRTGLEVALGNFNATLRDYARLGIVLANDGVRPDDPRGTPIVPREFLLDATDWKRAPPPFRPGAATPHLGYGYQFWLYPGQKRRFIMLGVYGQSVFIDPALKLVIVQTGANATAQAGDTTLGRERDAFWRGVMAYYAQGGPRN
jgi:CubicO group peptidase (beta-lactamase class C family)